MKTLIWKASSYKNWKKWNTKPPNWNSISMLSEKKRQNSSIKSYNAKDRSFFGNANINSKRRCKKHSILMSANQKYNNSKRNCTAWNSDSPVSSKNRPKFCHKLKEPSTKEKPSKFEKKAWSKRNQSSRRSPKLQTNWNMPWRMPKKIRPKLWRVFKTPKKCYQTKKENFRASLKALIKIQLTCAYCKIKIWLWKLSEY